MRLNDPESCAGGDLWSLVGVSKGRTAPGPPGWGLGGGLITRSRKKKLITETETIGKQGYKMLTPG